MKALLVAASLAAIAPTCTPKSETAERVEYDPGEAGTIAHALCLLGYTVVPLRELGSGHHVVEATLNGRRGTFVLDTGANATVLHAGFARDFALERGLPGGAIGIGGSMKASQVRIDSLRIGPVERGSGG